MTDREYAAWYCIKWTTVICLGASVAILAAEFLGIIP